MTPQSNTRSKPTLARGVVVLLGLATIALATNILWPTPDNPRGVLEPVCKTPVEIVDATGMRLGCAQEVLAVCGVLQAGARVKLSAQQACVVEPHAMSAKANILLGRKLDVNLATADDLRLLAPVGPALAKAIVEHRNQHGPFVSLEALDAVPGVGPKKFEALLEVVEIVEPVAMDGLPRPYP